MISSASSPGSTDPGTSTAATPTTADAPATPFDTILSLETLAATISMLDMAGAACLSPDMGLDDLPDTSVGEQDDDSEDGEAAGPLEFLALLLAMPTTTPVQPGNAGSSAGEGDLTGGTDSPAQPPAQPVTAAMAPPVSTAAEPTAQPVDVTAAGKLLMPDTATDAAGQGAARADAASGSDPTAQSPMRGAEWFGQAVRHAAAGERNSIVTHARDPRWAEEFGARIALMVRGGESAASLQLSPVDLGPMEVSISVKDSQASIHFGAAQAETRNLIEASIPRLREMLAAQGFQLMDASVSQGFARQSRSDVPPAQRHEGDVEAETQTTTRVTATGLLDTYA